MIVASYDFAFPVLLVRFWVILKSYDILTDFMSNRRRGHISYDVRTMAFNVSPLEIILCKIEY
jgi:hypothetical protein